MQNKTNQLISLIPTKHPHLFQVRLNLDFQTRYIGKIDTSGEGTFLTNRKEQHLFRKANSLGINYSLLSDDSIRFKWIVISYNGKKLKSTRNYFIKKGQAFQFSNKGFELQVFVPLEEINLKTAEAFEKTFEEPLTLFSLAV